MTTSYRYGAFFFLLHEREHRCGLIRGGLTKFCTPYGIRFVSCGLIEFWTPGRYTSLISLFSSSAARSSSSSSCIGGFMVPVELRTERDQEAFGRQGQRAEGVCEAPGVSGGRRQADRARPRLGRRSRRVTDAFHKYVTDHASRRPLPGLDLQSKHLRKRTPLIYVVRALCAHKPGNPHMMSIRRAPQYLSQ